MTRQLLHVPWQPPTSALSVLCMCESVALSPCKASTQCPRLFGTRTQPFYNVVLLIMELPNLAWVILQHLQCVPLQMDSRTAPSCEIIVRAVITRCQQLPSDALETQ